MNRLHVVIPALNEAPNLERLFADLQGCAQSLAGRYAVRIVLVDDGSTDGTGNLAKTLAGTLPCEVVRHHEPMGPGKAFADAFSYISRTIGDNDLVLTLEADNTSRLALVETMLKQHASGSHFVFASPYMNGGGVVNTGLWRVVLSRLANTFVKQGLGIRGLYTVSSFYRLHSGSAFRHMQRSYGSSIIERSGFECMVEMTMKMRMLDLGISEVPMVLDSSQRIGASRMRIMRTARGYLTLFLHRRRWARMAAGAAPMPEASLHGRTLLDAVTVAPADHQPARVPERV